MTLVALPYWLEWRLVVILIVGAFLFVIYKEEGSLMIIPKSFATFAKKLYNMIFRHIEDEEAYEANKDEREANEKYIKEQKAKKKKK